MSEKAITPRLADRLSSLAESQLQTQAVRSASVDAGALGVMTVDAAVAAIVIGVRGAYDLWIVALALLGLSLGLAVRVVRTPGAERTGPLIDDILRACETEDDDRLERSLLQDLAADMRINRRALARKGLLFNRAQSLLVLTILVELAGRTVQ
jgi:hypothetical protein